MKGPRPEDRGLTSEQRYWRRVRVTPGCWEWTGVVMRNGYGRLGDKLAHRLAYEKAHGPIPDGMEVMHSCDNAR